MCGILGQIKLTRQINPDPVQFKKALHLLFHRGPDDSGIVSHENFIFGLRRLSIQDLSRLARQPMTSPDGAVTLTFNGEIYNFRELRRRLEGKGYRFASSGDSEVLMNGLHCYGIDFVQQCNGMFAFAVYDRRSETAYLARDRLGLKPLYYTCLNGRFTFASEVKSILALESLTPRLNLGAVASYIAYRYPILGDTFFEDVFSLPPAHFLKVREGDISLSKYWDPIGKFEERRIDKGEQYYLEELKRLIHSSFQYRLISDVPLGVCLSGGVDSSIIAALTAQESRTPVESFCIGYDEDEFNEFQFARLASEKYGTRHHELLRTTDGYLENLEKLIGYKDAPLSIPNEVPLYQMATEMKKKVTVALTGNGSDEIFCGYGRIFRSVDDYRRLKTLNAAADHQHQLTFLANFKRKYNTTSFASELDHFLSLYNYTPGVHMGEILNPSIDLGRIEERHRQRFQTLFNEVPTGDYLDKMVYAFVKIHLPGILLYQDMAFMASSMEARVPFIDHRVVEFAFTIPHHYLMRWQSAAKKEQCRLLMSDIISEKYDTPKYILKKAFESEIPHEILHRKKKGFPVPVHKWFGSKGCEFARDLILSDRALGRGLYNTKCLTEWLKEKGAGDDPARARRLWMLFNLELFIRRYFDAQAAGTESPPLPAAEGIG